MQLKLAKKKEINEDVLRMIIQYGLGFASRVKNLENKEIEDWKEDKLYEKGAKVLYNNYLWVAKVTNQSSTWNESYWEKVGDNLELIDLDTIKTMLGLTTDELQTLSSIILDSQVRLDKTYSSSKIYTDLQQCLSDSKAFTLQEFAKASKASYKVVSATSQMLDKSVIYLMANGSNYDMYIVESDGTPTKIGDTTIDLSQFYTKTEINNDFVKKTDADGKYATITTVDGKVDKTSIVTTISSTPSDDKLLSEKAIKSELDTINTNLDDKINKASITTTIDSSSTSTDIASARAVYDKVGKYKIYHGSDLGITNSTTLPEMVQLMPDYSILYVDWNPDLMASNSKWFAEDISYGLLEIVRNTQGFIRLELTFLKRKFFFEGNINDVTSNIMFFTKVCSTSVADVPSTPIISKDTGISINSNCVYKVINGICYITLWGFVANTQGKHIICNSLPKAKTTMSSMCCYGENGHTGGNLFIREGTLYTEIGTTGQPLYGTLSYPVAE